jgi:hypothetical protein
MEKTMSGIAPAISHKGDGEKKVETNTVIMAYLDNVMI